MLRILSLLGAESERNPSGIRPDVKSAKINYFNTEILFQKVDFVEVLVFVPQNTLFNAHGDL